MLQGIVKPFKDDRDNVLEGVSLGLLAILAVSLSHAPIPLTTGWQVVCALLVLPFAALCAAVLIYSMLQGKRAVYLLRMRSQDTNNTVTLASLSEPLVTSE